MVPAGNKAKSLLSVNHPTKTIHHHHLSSHVANLDDTEKNMSRERQMKNIRGETKNVKKITVVICFISKFKNSVRCANSHKF